MMTLRKLNTFAIQHKLIFDVHFMSYFTFNIVTVSSYQLIQIYITDLMLYCKTHGLESYEYNKSCTFISHLYSMMENTRSSGIVRHCWSALA